jgi:hypothetical protein
MLSLEKGWTLIMEKGDDEDEAAAAAAAVAVRNWESLPFEKNRDLVRRARDDDMMFKGKEMIAIGSTILDFKSLSPVDYFGYGQSMSTSYR